MPETIQIRDATPEDLSTLPSAADIANAVPVDRRTISIRPAGGPELAEFIESNPYAGVDLEEFRLYRDYKQSQSPKVASALWGGVKGAGQSLWNFGKALVTEPERMKGVTDEWEREKIADASLLEAASRAVWDFSRLGRPAAEKLEAAFTDQPFEAWAKQTGTPYDKAEYSRYFQSRRTAFAGSALPTFEQATKKPVPLDKLSPATRQAIEGYENYKVARDYDRFMVNRLADAQRFSATTGQDNLAFKDADPALAEAMIPLMDPVNAATLGAGAVGAHISRSLARKAFAGTAKATATGAEAAGSAATRLATLPERTAGAAATAITGSEAAGEATRKAVSTAATAGFAGALGGVDVPGATQLAKGITTGKVAGAALSKLGEAGQAVARIIQEGPSQFGALQRLSLDPKAPAWLQESAARLTVLDPALELAGRTASAGARGAASGAAFGAGLGLAASGGDVETAAGVAGGGAMFGAAGGVAGVPFTRQQWIREAQNRDLDNLLARMDTPTLAKFLEAQPTRDGMLKVGALMRMFPELTYQPVTKAEARALMPGGDKLQGWVARDGTTYYHVVDNASPSAAFHEFTHGLENLDLPGPAMERLNRRLFSQSVDGQTISDGVFTVADQQQFAEKYLNLAKGTEVETRLRNLQQANPAEFAAEMQAEMRAFLMQDMLHGASSDLLPTLSSAKRRALDGLLLNDKAGWLQNLATRILRSDDFTSAGRAPIDLYFEAGTHAAVRPQVEAALRTFLREASKVKKAVAPEGSERGTTVIRGEDFGRQTWLTDLYDGLDVYRRLPDGSIERTPTGAAKVLTWAEVEKREVARGKALQRIVDANPDPTNGRSVQFRPERGNWTGILTERQLEAIDAAPNDLFPPVLKARIRAANQAIQQGKAILIDYNSATREGRGGGRVYASISPITRLDVPYELEISKAGNVNIKSIGLTNLQRKIAAWAADKPGQLDLWNRNPHAVEQDVLTVLRNKSEGKPAALGLADDPAVALSKRNVVLDLLNLNPDLTEKVSTGRDIDRVIRSRRLDRINRLQDGGNVVPFTLDTYYRTKLIDKPSPISALPYGQDRQLASFHLAPTQGSMVFLDDAIGQNAVTSPEALRLAEVYARTPLDRALALTRNQQRAGTEAGPRPVSSYPPHAEFLKFVRQIDAEHARQFQALPAGIKTQNGELHSVDDRPVARLVRVGSDQAQLELNYRLMRDDRGRPYIGIIGGFEDPTGPTMNFLERVVKDPEVSPRLIEFLDSESGAFKLFGGGERTKKFVKESPVHAVLGPIEGDPVPVLNSLVSAGERIARSMSASGELDYYHASNLLGPKQSGFEQRIESPAYAERMASAQSRFKANAEALMAAGEVALRDYPKLKEVLFDRIRESYWQSATKEEAVALQPRKGDIAQALADPNIRYDSDVGGWKKLLKAAMEFDDAELSKLNSLDYPHDDNFIQKYGYDNFKALPAWRDRRITPQELTKQVRETARWTLAETLAAIPRNAALDLADYALLAAAKHRATALVPARVAAEQDAALLGSFTPEDAAAILQHARTTGMQGARTKIDELLKRKARK